MKILLTGANGFIGSKLCQILSADPYYELLPVVRQSSSYKFLSIGSIGPNTDWSKFLSSCECVIHTAGYTKSLGFKGDLVDELNLVNVEGTLRLAKQASESGVRRFIFLSTIKVNGEVTELGEKFLPDDIPSPVDDYASSKYQAEQKLLELAIQTGMEVVIIRSPLVYGPEAKGNFGSLIAWANKGIPLPLGSIDNKRSLVALDNLVDLILTCIKHPAAANQIFFAGDGEDLSTTELLQGIAKAAGMSSRLLPVPASVLMFMASLLGKKKMAQRLLGSLQVDISKARDLLGWTPPLSVEEGLRRCFVRNA